jgi:putative transposase
MEQQRDSVHTTFTYQPMPTPEQERTLETVVWRCRELYNAGLEERKAACETCHIALGFAMQSAQLPNIKAVRPEYHEINAQVLQDVLHRLDNTVSHRSVVVCRPLQPIVVGAGDGSFYTCMG